jgi:hypothetical protein
MYHRPRNTIGMLFIVYAIRMGVGLWNLPQAQRKFCCECFSISHVLPSSASLCILFKASFDCFVTANHNHRPQNKYFVALWTKTPAKCKALAYWREVSLRSPSHWKKQYNRDMSWSAKLKGRKKQLQRSLVDWYLILQICLTLATLEQLGVMVVRAAISETDSTNSVGVHLQCKSTIIHLAN